MIRKWFVISVLGQILIIIFRNRVELKSGKKPKQLDIKQDHMKVLKRYFKVTCG